MASVPLATSVPLELYPLIEAKLKERGESPSAYLKRLIMKDINQQ